MYLTPPGLLRIRGATVSSQRVNCVNETGSTMGDLPVFAGMGELSLSAVEPARKIQSTPVTIIERGLYFSLRRRVMPSYFWLLLTTR